MAKPFDAQLLWGYTTALITAISQASTCGWTLAQGPTQSAPKQLKMGGASVKS